MKNNCVLVNTARGGIVNEKDLETDCRAPLQYSKLSLRTLLVLLLTDPYNDGVTFSPLPAKQERTDLMRSIIRSRLNEK